MDNSRSQKLLGDYVELQRGNTYKSALLGQPGPVLLGLASIARNGGFRSDNLKTYGGDSDARMLLEPGDIYVSLKDVTQSADLLGAVSRVPSTISQGRLTQDTVKLNFKDGNAPKDYIYWLLRTPQYRAYCRAHATGTTNLGLPRDDFLSFPVPDITPNRKELVSLLQAFDDKIELNRRTNETLEAMARAIFKDWFVDFGPTRAKAEGRAPYLASEIWDLFPDALDDEDKPVGWEVGSISDLADTNNQSWTARNHPEFVDYVDLSNAKWGNIDAITTLAWEDAPSRARRIARAGDTIVGTTRPGNGSFAYISQDGLTVSTGFAVLSPREQVYRDVVHIAATRPENIARLANLADGHGGAYPAVKPNEVSDTELMLPGDSIFTVFAELVAPLRVKIESAKTESRTLAQTRDLLLPKLMSGEIRLRDAEKAVEAVA